MWAMDRNPSTLPRSTANSRENLVEKLKTFKKKMIFAGFLAASIDVIFTETLVAFFLQFPWD